MPDAVIVSAVRTPIGRFGGAYATVPAADLGAIVIRSALERAGVDPALVEEVLFGCVLQAGAGMNVARQASIKAGLPASVPSLTINKMCGSGLKAVALAAQAIRAGDAEVIVAGGTENMSRAPYLSLDTRTGARMGDSALVDSMLLDGLVDAFDHCHMGITAENVAEQWKVSREDQDEFAVTSQQRAAHALETGVFEPETVAVPVPRKRGDPELVKVDEHPKPDTTLEKLASLRPAFKKGDGTVTAGNASGVNDGAAAVVVTSERRSAELGLKPLALIRSYSSAGIEPRIMGMGPVPAIQGALRKAGVAGGDIDLWEVNEAFAAQCVAVGRVLEIPRDRLNVNGGAIALGHPIGASGTRILVTLLHEMGRRGSHLGVASLCIGGGQGIAAVVENGRA
jgi:acetyl-CoA C-acetyltransferase